MDFASHQGRALVAAVGRLCDAVEQYGPRDGHAATLLCHAGRRLFGHPAAVDLVLDLEWHRQAIRLRDLCRRWSQPISTEDAGHVEALVARAMAGRIPYDPVLTEALTTREEFEAFERRRGSRADFFPPLVALNPE